MSINGSRAAASRMSFTGGGSLNSLTVKTPKIRQERNTNFKVVIRVRPPLPRELSGDEPFRNVVAVNDTEQCLTVSENIDAVVDGDGNVVANPGPYTTYTFTFDYVYSQYCTQEKVYETTARTVVDSALQGYNATIFAYGQTGAGKTYTMEGFNREGNIEARGIIPRAIEQIFNHIQRFASPRMRFLVRASYLQIYNEQISDLLKPDRNNLNIREDKKRGVYVEGLSEWVVRSPSEIYGLMERGASVRATGETRMNEVSSRSHAVFIVIVEQSETVYVDDQGVELSPEDFQRFMYVRGVHREQEMNRLEDHLRQTFKVGKLNLVDLAGSERVEQSGATGQRFEESRQINRSLTMLGYVISALTKSQNRQHIPYRNSKLTRMLEDSLGGNCKTTMMAMVSPAYEAMLETISTLKFANRAKNIRNEAKVNEDLDQKSLLRKYERELKQLRAELEERSKNVVDKRRLLELDEQRKRAEADKVAAIRALEARSLEFMKEKEEKKKLEERIATLMNQMIRGQLDPKAAGYGAANNGPTEVLMKEQQDRLRQEYEFKLADLERERESIEVEKAQVDRYKQLLLKQRDIMIALTQRLVERDEQITALQDELDAYDRHQKELEEKLDEKSALLIKLQRISMEVNATSPQKNDELTRILDNWAEEERNRAKKSSGPLEIQVDDGDDAFSPSMRSNSHNNNKAAEEKIRQLSSLVENQKSQLAALEARLAESHATQSMNSHNHSHDGHNNLKIPGRRVMEQVMHQEMERYLSMIPWPTEAARLQSRQDVKNLLDKVMDRLREGASSDSSSSDELVHNLRQENERLKQDLSRSAHADSNNTLQMRCDTLVKEREAVQTILEHKIKVLVQSVAQTATAVVNTVAVNGSPAGQALTKDVAALQRLVNASIAALRNAAAGAPPPPPPPLHEPSPQSSSSKSSAPAPVLSIAPPAGTTSIPPLPSSTPYIHHDHAFSYSNNTQGWPLQKGRAPSPQVPSRGYYGGGTGAGAPSGTSGLGLGGNNGLSSSYSSQQGLPSLL
eukprot:gene3770-4120_t